MNAAVKNERAPQILEAAQPHLREAAELAENYEPDLYEVSFVDEVTN